MKSVPADINWPRKHSLLWMGIALLTVFLLTGVAFGVWMLASKQLEQQALERAALRAEHTGAMVMVHAGNSGQKGRGWSSLDIAFDRARQQHDLAYLVVTDLEGEVEGALNLYGARRAAYDQVRAGGQLTDNQVIYKTSMAVPRADGTLGRVYVGVSFAAFRAELAQGRREVARLSLLLMMLSLGLIYGLTHLKPIRTAYVRLVERDRSLQAERDHLAQEVAAYRHAEAELRQSEERYRGLFENAMESAYQDLEDLNQDLERQRDDLAKEVVERKRAEVALRESEERWRRLVESHPEPIMITVDGRVVYINKAGAEVYGADSQEALTGAYVLDLIAPRYRDVFEEQVVQIEAEANVSLECKIVRMDGEERFVEVYAVPVVHAGARASQTVVRDITERRRQEVALRRYTERLRVMNQIERSMLEMAPPVTMAEMALSQIRRLVPYKRASIIEYDPFAQEAVLLAAYTPQGASMQKGERLPFSFLQNIRSAQPNQIRYVKDLRTLKKPAPSENMLLADGMRSYFHVPLVVQDEVVGTINLGGKRPEAFTSEHINIVREVADLLAISIHQTRIEAERKLYEAELISAKEHAEEMAKLKSTFLTNMTHEFRTPLSGIIGFSQVLYEEVEPQQREFAELIEESAKRLLDTINSVLDLARLESDQMTQMPEPINIAQQAEQTVRLLMPLADKKGLTLAAHKYEPEAWARIDKASFDRVVTNLVGNAIKFTYNGGVHVSIEADAGTVYLKVQDTGVGISEEFLPYLFEEFRQEEDGIDRSHEGSGLGLAITHKLVTRMGGTITVDSVKDQGTMFTVAYPRIQTAARPAPIAPTIVAPERPRLLVIEDKEDAKYLLEYLLRSTYETDLASDLDMALHQAGRHIYDAILVDIMLGGKEVDGALLRRFRALPGYAGVPLVAIATNLVPENWDDLLRAGFDTYVANPFVKDAISNVLDGLLGSSRAA